MLKDGGGPLKLLGGGKFPVAGADCQYAAGQNDPD
jgi:hypothetical protein